MNLSLRQSGLQFEKNQSVLILAHHSPDGDAIGSILSCGLFLRKKGLRVQMVSPSAVPDYLKFPQNVDEILNFESDSSKIQWEGLDYIFCLDFSHLKRSEAMQDLIRSSTAKKICIDHHQHPENFADYYYHDETAAATCELIFRWISDLGEKDQIDQSIAEPLYLGIMTDTGSFRHPSTTAGIHKIAAELIETGIDFNRIHRKIEDSARFESLKFLGETLYNHLHILPDYKLSVILLSYERQQKYGLKPGDTEGLVNYGLKIKECIWTIFLKEEPSGVKFSFRSVKGFEVHEFAAAHFSGGGHPNASGGKLKNMSLEQAFEFLKEVLPLQSEKIKNFTID
ncbi:MAG: hypothetical protein RIR51_523 [Bacteroidota bacterium]|jgi:phosphoesterase RecJ-like protein